MDSKQEYIIHNSGDSMKRFAFASAIAASLVCMMTVATAQSLSNMTFSNTTATFTSIIGQGGTNLAFDGANETTNDDGYITGIPINFSFNYLGTGYTTLTACANGFVLLGGDYVTGDSWTPDISGSYGSDGRPIIAPFWSDMILHGTDYGSNFSYLGYVTTGSAPNRVFTLEWSNAEWPWNTGVQCISIQMKLYENSGAIQYIYQQIGSQTDTQDIQVGISNASTGSGSFITVVDDTYTTVSSTTAYVSSSRPASNTCVSFIPMSSTLTAPTAFSATNVTPSGMTLNWTNNASGAYAAAIFMSSNGGSTYSQVAYQTMSGTGSYSKAISGLTSGVNYLFRIYAINTSGTSDPLSGSQTTPTIPLSGTRTIPSANYPTIKTAIDSMAAYGVNGALTFELSSSYNSSNEPSWPLTFVSVQGASNTNQITFRPATGVTGCSISSNQTGGIIYFNGAKYIHFDGRPGGSGTTSQLTIENTYVGSTSSIKFGGDAQYNCFRYCTIRGAENSTSSGTVVFAAGSSQGNNYDTLRNNDIREATAGGFPSNAIYCAGSSTLIQHDNVLANNNIYNWGPSSGTAYGFYCSSAYYKSWTISGNSFYQTSARTVASTFAAIYLAESGTGAGNGVNIVNNYIGGSAPQCGGSAMIINTGSTFYGILAYVSSATYGTKNVSGNTIANIVVNTSTTSVYFCYTYYGDNTITNNVIGSATSNGSLVVNYSGTSTATVYGLYSYPYATIGEDEVLTGNVVGGITMNATSTGGFSFIGLYWNGSFTTANSTMNNNLVGSTTVSNSIYITSTSTTVAQTLRGIYLASSIGNVSLDVSNNTVANLTNLSAYVSSGSSYLHGIYGSSGIHTIANNQVYNLTCAAPNSSSTNTTMALVGILEGSTTTPAGPNGHTISGNKVYNLVNTNSTTANIWTVGISLNASTSAGYNTVSKNFIHSLNSQSSTTSVGVGFLSFGTPIRMYNNMLRLGIDASGSSITGSMAIYGIYKAGTYAALIADNSVYVGGSGVSGSNTFCLWRNALPSSGIDNIRNNIFQNARSNGSGTGAHICVMLGNSSAANAAAACSLLTLNNNLYYHSGGGGNIGGILYTPGSTIYVYSTMTSWSGASGQDASSGYAATGFAYPAGSSSTVNLHVTGTTAAHGGGVAIAGVSDDYDGESRPSSFPDIGADQCNSCSSNDIFAPTISYTALTNGIVESARTVNNVVITDYTGVNSSSGTKPRIYYKKSTDADQYVGNTSTDNGWKWTEATNASSPFAFSIDYSKLQSSMSVGDVIDYFVIAQDLVSTPNVGASVCAFTSFPSSVSIQNSSFPSANYGTYTLSSTISGTINVGPTESITSLTNTGGLFDVINNRVVTGNLNIVVTGNLTSESGTVALNQTSEYGTGNYTISVRPAASTNDTISGSYTGGLVRLSGADRVTIDGRPIGSTSGRNLTFINNTTSGTLCAIQLVSLGTGAGCMNDTIRYCNVATGSNTNTTATAVFSGSATIGTGGDDNDNFAFTNNFVYRTYYGVRIIGTGAGKHDNVLFDNNYIGSLGSGLPAGDTIKLCGLQLSSCQTPTVTNNLFKDWSMGSTGSNCINIDNADSLLFNNNVIDDIISPTSSGYDFQALWLGSNVTNSRVTRNKFNKIQYQSTGNWWAYGIYVNTGTQNSNLLIANNVISNVANDYGTSTTYVCIGLKITSCGGIKVYNNSILMRGPYFNTTSTAYSYDAVILSGCSNIELVNNIFSNRMYGASADKSYAVYVAAAGELSASDYNIYDVSLGTTQGVTAYYAGSDYSNLAAYAAAAGTDMHSLSTPVMYVDSSATSDLHLLQQEPSFRGTNSVSSLVPVDFDGFARSNYLIGADEVTPVMNISQQPSPATACVGQSTSFTTSLTTPVQFNDGVSRSTSISYQWYKGSSPISGATSNTLTLNSVTTADAANYTCHIFSSSIDSIITSVAALTVNTLPTITQDPASANRCLGANMVFSGTATGTNIGYQWQKLVGATWTDISGATSANYTIASLVAGDYTSYRFIVTGACTPPDTSASASLTQLTPTSISVQPTATPSSICLGANFTLNVTAQASNIGYQWRRNGNSITGATNSSLTITNAQPTDFATYSVAVSGDCGVVISNNVIVSQIAPTVITAAASTTTPQVCLGQPFTISVSATGANLQYQWRKGGTNIASATASSYTVAAATASDFASYDVVVTGTCGSLTSGPVTIIQIPPTAIGTQPTPSVTICEGTAFNVSVGATGSNLTYQWQKESGATWNAISGATSSSYSIASVVPSNAGTYRVIVSGTCGPVTSDTCVLVVNSPITILTQPAFSSPNACTGESTTLSMTAGGTVTSYQWQKFNGSIWVPVAGATSNIYTISPLALSDAGSYRMVLNGPCSATTTSNQAVLSVQQNVQVSTDPQPQTVCAGGAINLSVSTIGTVLGYQWEQDQTNSGTWVAISGATNSTYTKTNVSNADSGMYHVKVTGNCSAIPVVSAAAKVTVQTPFTITGQPSWPSTPYNVGQMVTLTVTVTGTANFQWQRDQQRTGGWVNVGNNSPVYSYVISSIADSGNYRCVVSGPCGATTQNTNTVAVYTCQPPTVTSQPVTPTPVCVGGAFSLSVGVNGNGQSVSYQWYQDAARNGTWSTINGATNSTYSKANVQLTDDGNYRVQVISACSAVPVYSNPVSFVVLSSNTITSNPTSQTVCGGTTVTMSVTAAGASPSYQWYYNGAPINTGQNTTAQTANLVLTNVTNGNAGTYKCFVTGPCTVNGTFSNDAMLTVNTPVVLLQPQSMTGCVGSSLSFTAQISGSGLSYQWQKNLTAITGATNTTYTISNPTLADAGSYRLVGTNSCGTATTNAAVLSMTVPASIIVQPQSQTVCRNTNLTLSVTINSDATSPSYQWQRNGSNLSLTTYPTANTPNLTISNIQSAEAGNYTCIVMSACQPVGFSSAVATVVVNPSTAIITQPVGTTICEGTPYTMSVGAIGTNLSYQWMKNGAAISGATNYTLNLNNPSATDAGSYYAIVSGSCSPTSVNSSVVNVTVNTNPRITSAALSNQSACIGSTVSFGITATGTGLAYQWRFNGTPISGNASALTPTLVLSNVTIANGGSYDCKVTGTCVPSGVTSNAAVLTINTPIVLLSNPQNQVSCTHQTVSFSVSNTGSGAAYQWRYNGAAINNNASAATSTLILSDISTSSAGVYDCVISGTCNTVTSTAAALTVQTQLMIMTQPQPQRVCAGGIITTFVTVNGTTISYQWQKDGVNISGQTNSNLVLTGVTTSQSGGYRCIITGSTACGTTQQVSNTVDVLVGTTATFVNQPTDVAVSFGATVSVSAQASGLGNGVNNILQYQWYKGTTLLTDDSHYSGSSTNVLTIRGILPTDIGSDYSVKAIGICGSATSNQFALYVPSVSITSQPQSSALCNGENANFSVIAVPSPITSTLYYQWYRGATPLSDGGSISGATTSTLKVNGVSAADSGSYTCEITVQPGGSRITSSAAALQVNAQPIVTTQPTDASVCLGSALNLSVSATGGSLTYQWKKGGADISGATNATFVIGAVTPSDAGQYTVVVRNDCGVATSSVAVASIAPAPSITTQPVSQTVSQNGVFSLSVVANGTGTLRYQWKFNGSAIPGATNSTLTISGTTTDNEGNYTCDVMSDCGTTTSSTAVITVTPDGIVDAQQFGYEILNPQPNPASDFATIRFRVPQTKEVTLDLSDLQGRRVATLVNAIVEEGEHSVVLSASSSNLASGSYMLRLITSEGYVTTKTIVIVR